MENRSKHMKTLLKIFALLCLICALALVGGYFLLTSSGFQKRMIEKRLPEGSSLDSVKVTLDSASLKGLVLALPDGTRVKLESLDTRMSPLAAVFDRTIELGVLHVNGLLVDVPTALIPSSDEVQPPAAPDGGDATPPATGRPDADPGQPAAGRPSDPLEGIYALGDLDWLFDIEGIDVDGQIRDVAGNRFSFELDAEPIKPGQRSRVNGKASLVSGESMQAGLKSFEARLGIEFNQLADGGFDEIQVDSELSGADASAERLLAATSRLRLKIDGFRETAEAGLKLEADVPQPARILPELGSLGAVNLSADLEASAEGGALLLRKADGALSANGAPVAQIDLQQSLALGGEQNFTGELLTVQLSDLPLAWVNPFLGNGMSLQGAPLSMDLLLTGESGGVLRIEARQPIMAGPLSLSREGQELLRDVTVTLEPVIRLASDQTVDYQLNALKVADRYGAFLEASARGRLQAVGRGPDNPFAGIRTEASLQLDLASLLDQPFSTSEFALLGGSLESSLVIDGEADYPAQIQGVLRKLRTPDAPAGRDYRFAAQSKRNQSGAWQIGANLEAGPDARPSTALQFAGEVDPKSQPLRFSAKLTGDRVTQADLTHLADAFAATTTEAEPEPRLPEATPRQAPQPQPPTVADVVTGEAPPWALLDGNVAVSIEEILLESGQRVTGLNAEARVSEQLLALESIRAQVGEGKLSGKSEVRYAAMQATPYELMADVNFDDVDPSVFARPGESFPVRGNFNGAFTGSGAGTSLESALDAVQGELTISGTEGVVTAFELEGRTQMGLIGAGILGQQLNRPGITALAQTVPYFKDIRFDDFTLKINRGEDRRLMIPRLRIEGANLLIDSSGFVAATSWADVMDQPLNLKLELGAKGKLVDYLETLGLLRPDTGEDGFRRWAKDLNIGGTLGDPNTSAIMKLLSDAARRALREPTVRPEERPEEGEAGAKTEDEATQSEGKEKSKEERISEDVRTGLELLNSLLGN